MSFISQTGMETGEGIGIKSEESLECELTDDNGNVASDCRTSLIPGHCVQP